MIFLNWWFNLLAEETLLSSDNIDQWNEPQSPDSLLLRNKTWYWILNDQPWGKLTGNHSKQAVSKVELKWHWQERWWKGALGMEKFKMLSVIYWSRRPAGAVGTTSAPSLFLCTHLTPLRKEQQHLFNLKHFCPTEGLIDKGLSVEKPERAVALTTFTSPI